MIGEHDGTTGGVIYNYVYKGRRLLARMGSGVINWYVSDWLNTRLVLDASGNVIGRQGHLPFGDDFGESGSQEKHHFTSYERDAEAGTDYAVNRQYAQIIGKFTRPDPRQRSCDSGNPQKWNGYSYTRNDPENRVDPSGLEDLMSTISNLNWWAQWYWLLLRGPGVIGTHGPLLDSTGDGGLGEPLFAEEVVFSHFELKSKGWFSCKYGWGSCIGQCSKTGERRLNFLGRSATSTWNVQTS